MVKKAVRHSRGDLALSEFWASGPSAYIQYKNYYYYYYDYDDYYYYYHTTHQGSKLKVQFTFKFRAFNSIR